MLFPVCPTCEKGEVCPCKSLPAITSIWTAAWENDAPRITYLVRGLNKDPSRPDVAGYTALHYAAQQGYHGTVAVLLDLGAKVSAKVCGATPLHRAAYAGKLEVCRLLLAKGADRDIDGKDTSFGDQRTALHKAASQGHKGVCDLLLAHGADPRAVDREGLTPEALWAQRGRGGEDRESGDGGGGGGGGGGGDGGSVGGDQSKLTGGDDADSDDDRNADMTCVLCGEEGEVKEAIEEAEEAERHSGDGVCGGDSRFGSAGEKEARFSDPSSNTNDTSTATALHRPPPSYRLPVAINPTICTECDLAIGGVVMARAPCCRQLMCPACASRLFRTGRGCNACQEKMSTSASAAAAAAAMEAGEVEVVAGAEGVNGAAIAVLPPSTAMVDEEEGFDLFGELMS